MGTEKGIVKTVQGLLGKMSLDQCSDSGKKKPDNLHLDMNGTEIKIEAGWDFGSRGWKPFSSGLRDLQGQDAVLTLEVEVVKDEKYGDKNGNKYKLNKVIEAKKIGAGQSAPKPADDFQRASELAVKSSEELLKEREAREAAKKQAEVEQSKAKLDEAVNAFNVAYDAVAAKVGTDRAMVPNDAFASMVDTIVMRATQK